MLFAVGVAQDQYQCSLLLYIAAFHIEEQHHLHKKAITSALVTSYSMQQMMPSNLSSTTTLWGFTCK